MSSILTRELIYREYVGNRLSDKQIAEKYGFDRTSITKIRKRFNIQTANKFENTSQLGVHLVERKLRSLGYKVDNKRQSDKLSTYDFLVNSEIKVLVKSSKCHKNRFSFAASVKQNGISENNENYTRLPNGRLKKVFSSTCDIVVLCGIDDDNKIASCFVLPVEIADSYQTINIPVNRKSNSKWFEYKNAWNYLEELCNAA